MPGTEGISEHVTDSKAAHAASAIEHDGAPDVFISGNVEGALDEIIGAVAKRPPYLGQWSLGVEFSGITDWGYLKLRDASLNNYQMVLFPPAPMANLPNGVSPSDIFPYYFSAPGPAQDYEFTNEGEDPRTDWIWNTGTELATYKGMGYGRAHIGGFTRDGDVGPAPKDVVRSARLYPRPTVNDAETGKPYRVPVTISGSIFPADRGVLALFHFPRGGRLSDMQADFLAQPLITDQTVAASPTGRVVAALLMGNGLLTGGNCYQGACASTPQCDGSSGGIFGVGTDPVTDKYDPFAYPGRATGQYNLQEIHTGIAALPPGDELRAPWNDFNDDGITGAKRTATATIPAPGQVRLGTDPDAGVTPGDYGIPILGGTVDYFDVDPGPENGSLGESIWGDTLLLASNFFGYRLPVLQDYSQATGLKWTPRPDGIYSGPETMRYFYRGSSSATNYEDGTPIGTYLRSAGFYESSFAEDYWTWQVARYRHTFLMPSRMVNGLREEVGSYWLVHFKTEADFEKFARDGIFPWDATDGYEVYGYSLAGSPPLHIEETKNVVNEWPDATPAVSPDGPAPEYGYAANPYHEVRSAIFLDPSGTALPVVTTADYTWVSGSVPGTEAVVWVSGVSYFTPNLAADGAGSFYFSDINLVVDPGFWTSFRTNQDDLSINDTVAPAILASVNPLFLNMAPWAYGTPISLTVPVGAPAANVLTAGTRFLGTHRVEIPFEYLGSNAGGVFSDANGPLDADSLTIAFTGANVVPLGDTSTPAFTRDAVLRAYMRRPLDHVGDDTTTLPFGTDAGHGTLLAPVGGKRILFHTTKFNKAAPALGEYGNYVVAGVGAPPNTSYVELCSADKDTLEAFLDETHRYIPNFDAINGLGPYTLLAAASLVGPGMGGWVGGPIEVPVRANLVTAPWNACSWLLMEKHLVDLTDAGDPDTVTGLQVAGLPDRNPVQSAAVSMPFPSSGMLVYPQEDFTSVVPEGAVHFAGAQPDYSAAVGTRSYLRAFDAAFSNSVDPLRPPVNVGGSSTVVLRIDGVTLSDLAYAAPGPGGVPSDKIAILVKIPGSTTWMDIGRADGAGPGKQDMFADGAGCMVVGPETYDFQDPVSGYRGCYVKVNVGPMAALFDNLGIWSNYTVGDPVSEAPVMVKVVQGAGAVKYDLRYRLVGGVFEILPAVGAAPNEVRGVIGVRLVHPNDVLIAP